MGLAVSNCRAQGTPKPPYKSYFCVEGNLTLGREGVAMATAVRVRCVSCGRRAKGAGNTASAGLEQRLYSSVGPFLHISTRFLLSISHLRSSFGFFSPLPLLTLI